MNTGFEQSRYDGSLSQILLAFGVGYDVAVPRLPCALSLVLVKFAYEQLPAAMT